jgi:HSP90 family molecular chaperone
LVSLDDYIKKMRPGQSKIYFVTAANKEAALGNPFMDPFRNNPEAPPVLILTNNVDEICFQQIGDYKSHRFANIETSFDEIQNDLKINLNQTPSEGAVSLPEEDVTGFSLWLKNELQQFVSKVSISKRLKNQPAVLIGQVSSSMRMVMAMMEQ